jgi:hypothetical protein
MQNSPKCKTLKKKLVSLEKDIIRKKRKISVPCFQSKTEVAKGGGGKNYFHNDTILVDVFP